MRINHIIYKAQLMERFFALFPILSLTLDLNVLGLSQGSMFIRYNDMI